MTFHIIYTPEGLVIDTFHDRAYLQSIVDELGIRFIVVEERIED